MVISKNDSISYNIENNNEPLTYRCLVVYATKRLNFAKTPEDFLRRHRNIQPDPNSIVNRL